MTRELYNDFYKKHGANVHTDPLRFSAIAEKCHGRLLDVACGTGDLADFYHGEYVGVDISDTAVELARMCGRKNATFVLGDVLDIAFEFSEHYDTIVLAEFLEHIKDDKPLFDHLLKITNPGGRWVITVPNWDRVPDSNHVRTFSVADLRRDFAKYGRVKFWNYEGFEARILMTVDVGKPNDEDITLAMIIKNEELGMEKTIVSALPFVDHVLISIDSKSVDGSYDLAMRYADVVAVHNWQNDFSAIRNGLQARVVTPWVFWLDGHEPIKKCEGLPELLQKKCRGINIKIFMEDGTFFWYPRIIRKEVKWEAAVHNYPLVPTDTIGGEIEIQHDRDNLQAEKSRMERSKQRHEMIFSIMRENVRKDPKDQRSTFYLGQQSIFERNFKLAKYWYKRYLKIGTNKGERWDCCYSLSVCCANLGQRFRALYWLWRAEKEIPGRWEIAKRQGAVYMWLGLPKLAVERLVKGLTVQKGPFSFNPEKRDDAETWDMIGRCFLDLRQFPEAKAAWARSLEIEQKEDRKGALKERQKRLEFLIKNM